MGIPFFDLKAGYEADKAEMDAAALRVLASGHWVGGAEVEAFEKAFAQWSGLPFAVGLANGTDAITLALWAAGVGEGDEVIAPALSAFPTSVGVMRSGATLVYVDVREDGLIDPALAAKAKTAKTKAIVPVHLYGNPCDMAAIKALGLTIVEDCAQAHGVEAEGGKVGSFSKATAWSFYPTKNLGAAGDAGAATAQDAETAGKLSRLRNYGQKDRYYHVEQGVNSRLDPIQAAILNVRLPKLSARNERRRKIGAFYDEALKGQDAVRVIPGRPGTVRNRHLYPVFTKDEASREKLKAALLKRGVETLVHYPVAMPDQAAAPKGAASGQFPIARRLAATELSIPVYPELTDAQAADIAQALKEAAKEV